MNKNKSLLHISRALPFPTHFNGNLQRAKDRLLAEPAKLYMVLEITIVIAWAMWVGHRYLDFSPTILPAGDEFAYQVYDLFGLQSFRECGLCALWNGSVDGGYPTFANLQGATQHPLVILLVLLFGVINGAKLLMVCSLAIAGLAQWWMARVMGLSPAVRIWAGAVAVVGGHLASVMAGGQVSLIFSIASASLVIPPLIDLALTRRRRSAVLAGVFLALALLSGQTYSQIALIFAVLPAFVVFLIGDQPGKRSLFPKVLLALVIAFLLSAVLWVPMLHFWNSYVTEIDPSFNSAQSVDAIPLNLLLQEGFSLFIGWGPVLLALLAFHLVSKKDMRLIAYLYLSAVVIFVLSSQNFLMLIHDYIAETNSIRYPSYMASLAVPFVLGLAAWSLDRLMRSRRRLFLVLPNHQSGAFRLSGIIFVLALIFCVLPAYRFSQQGTKVVKVDLPASVMEWLDKKSTQWLHITVSDPNLTPYLLGNGYKITDVWRVWHWEYRYNPAPSLEISSSLPSFPAILDRHAGNQYYQYLHTEYEYAWIKIGEKGIPCRAHAAGGNIDVTCESDLPGMLVVQENYFSGWHATMDGRPIPLAVTESWLLVKAPAGQHTYSFRYRPWDVWVGLAISFIGILFVVFNWRKPKQEPL